MSGKTILLTYPVIERCESLANSYTRETLEALGVEYPPMQGWKRALHCREISEEDYERALAGRSKAAKKLAPIEDKNQLALF